MYVCIYIYFIVIHLYISTHISTEKKKMCAAVGKGDGYICIDIYIYIRVFYRCTCVYSNHIST